MAREKCLSSAPLIRLDIVPGGGDLQVGSDSSSTWSDNGLICIGLLLNLLFFVFSAAFVPCTAFAATWPVPASELSPSVGFHESYTAGDNSYGHSGIDIPASAGMPISTPAAGTVSFTGAVPSGDSRISGAPSHKTMRAVSIKLSDGKTVTLMPFASIEVKRGGRVSEGQLLGTLAATGDVSSRETHLHMGLKRERTYYDPMSLFGASSETPNAEPLEEPEGAKAPLASAPAVVPAAETTALEPASQENLQEGRESGRSKTKERAREKAKSRSKTRSPQVQWKPGTVTSGDIAWQPEEQGRAAGPLELVSRTADSFVWACAWQGAALIGGLKSLSQGTGIPEWIVYLAACGLGLALVTACIWAFARWAVPLVGSLWRKARNVWNEGNKRGKLLGLFPAPGSAFIPRGR